MSESRRALDQGEGTGHPDTPTGPVIPDGGLGTAMPEWLQQPPAWKRPVADLEEPRVLPPPDTSPIDPRTMLELEDLPEWLQAIAARAKRAGEAEPDVDHAVVPPVPVDELEEVASSDTEPTPVAATASLATHLDTASRQRTDRPWWISDWVMATLLVAVVLTLIYVILVASDAL